MFLRVALATAALLGSGGGALAGAASGAASGAPSTGTVLARPVGVARADPPAVVTYTAPVAPVSVIRPFEPPSSPYGPGHRGVDLATSAAQSIAAAADGTVRFAGRVAGRGVVVLAHADGITTEYEPVAVSVRKGDVVARGDPIGTPDGTHGPCDPGACLHWGAKRGETYLDPMTLLRGLGPVRLLPWSPAEDP